MKNTFALLILLSAFTAIGQPKKYQGLLWEISGNGLQKKSYVYGSMHVSEKVSYHLSDAFFTHLRASDYVATESDPSTWLELYSVFAQNRNFDSSYSGFYRHAAKREDLLPLFESSNFLMNNLMFRTTESRQDYQEETYLDLFIYQAGKKYNKQVVGLENAQKSIIDVLKAEPQSFNPDQEKVQAIMKLLKDRSYNQAMNDFYREKNLDLLDSLYVLATPKNYFKALILDRNVTMANGIDSIAKKGSLFAAVGAAHLPGRRGVIELLREKGYTVKPVSDNYSEIGRSIKSDIETQFKKPDFRLAQTRDSIISIPLPGTPNYFGVNIISPDLSNGAMTSVKRIALRQFLQKSDETFNPSRLDSLFYEHTPGDILSRNFSQSGDFPTYDITSRTKSGQSNRFRFYITPLEIVCVTMSGKSGYVQQFEKDVFSKIQIGNKGSDWKTIHPYNSEFSISAPAMNLVYAMENGLDGTEINAYEPATNSWYFAIEKTVSDNAYIEDTAFELNRIAFEFLRGAGGRLEIAGQQTSASTFQSKATIGNRKLDIKTVVKGQKYYLLGTVNASEEKTARFFSSLNLQQFPSQVAAKTLRDTTAHFSVSIPEKGNEALFWDIDSKGIYTDDDTEKNIFEPRNKSATFVGPTGKTVDLNYWEYHRYDYVANRDSLWSNLEGQILNKNTKANTAFSGLPKGYQATNDKDAMLEEWIKRMGLDDEKYRSEHPISLKILNASENPETQFMTWNVLSGCDECAQSIRHKIVSQGTELWWLKAIVEKNYNGDDPFIEQTFASFTPNSTLPAKRLYSHKFAQFVTDVKSGVDSLRLSALESVYRLQIDASELPELETFLSRFNPSADEASAAIWLIQKAADMKTDRVYDMFKKLYLNKSATSHLQLSILRALADTREKKAYDIIASLMEADLPVSDDSYSIDALFSKFASDPKNSKQLYPDVFAYFGIPEYQAPVLEFTSALIRSKEAAPHKIRKYRKLLLGSARLEFKRVSGANPDFERETDSVSNNSQSTEKLLSYLRLLYPYKKDKAISKFFRACQSLNDAKILLELASLQIEHGPALTDAQMQALLANKSTQYPAYLMFEKNGILPQHFRLPEKDLASAALTYAMSDNSKLTIDFVDQKSISNAGNTCNVFFFKVTNKNQDPELDFAMMGSDSFLAGFSFAPSADGFDPAVYRFSAVPYPLNTSDVPEHCNAIADEFLNGRHLRATFDKAEPLIQTEEIIEEE